MAKKKPATPVANRSDVIREILKAQPKASVKEVRAALESRGVKASDALINKIKYGRAGTQGKKRAAKGRKGHGSKADAIRTMFDQMGASARPRDVVAALAERGIKVTSAQVSTLRKALRRTGRASTAIGSVSFDHLVAAKSLAERLGGIENARHALEQLSRLIAT